MSDYRQRIYEKYASCHQSNSLTFDPVRARKWGLSFRQYLRGWLPESKQAQIVDLACGDGKLLFLFKELGYSNVTGVDLSPEQVQIAKQVNDTVEQRGVLDFLREHPAQFDLITALDLIEHLTKDEVLELLDGCREALKPGGRLVLQTPNAESPWGLQVRYGDFTHEVCFTPNVLCRLLELCGLVNPQPRELGPVALGYSFTCSVRHVFWRILRNFVRIYNIIETGSVGSGVMTRVFIVSAQRLQP